MARTVNTRTRLSKLRDSDARARKHEQNNAFGCQTTRHSCRHVVLFFVFARQKLHPLFQNAKIHEKGAFVCTSSRASSSKNENDNTDESKPQNELIEALDTIAQRENLVKRNKRKQPDIIVENASPPPVFGGGAGVSNTVMGPGTSEEWRELDEKVNSYPSERKFQAIGINSPEFVQDMVKLVEDTLGDGRKVHPENVTSNLSKNGKYCSANMTVVLMSGEEVINIMAKLKADERVKWYL